MRTHFSLFRATVFAGTLLAAAGAARADLIIFKDGFLLHGKVTREGETIVDPASGQALVVPKGAFFIVEGARRVHFSFTQVQDVDDKNFVNREEDIIRLARPLGRLNAQPIDPLVELGIVGPWDDRWERSFTIGVQRGNRHLNIAIQQRLGQLTPHCARVDALRYQWSAYYQTSELGPETVRSLLSSHPDLQMKGDASDFAKRLRIYRFLVQAGWYDEAEQELDKMQKDTPSETEKIDRARAHLKELRLLQKIEELERGQRSGQHQWVQKQLADFPRQGMDEKLLIRLRSLSAKYEATAESLKLARQFLKELPPRVFLVSQSKFFAEAADTILNEITIEHVGRLETFLNLTQQAERERAQGRTPEHGPAQLLSLAVTGWLLGKDSAEAKIESAQRLWQARRFVLDYQKTPELEERAKILRAFESQKNGALAVDEVAHLLTHLPPPEPEKTVDADPIELQTQADGRKKGNVYLAQLPPEYHHGRAFPVLIALCNAGEKPKDMLERCNALAARNGYILAVPDWGGQGSYQYTPEEHAAVQNVLYDLRRRFQVDSDRVFLLGYGEGGNMAYDVGLAHPDLFAGVLPVSGMPRLFAQRYVPNSQYLPFYVVNGDLAGDLSKQNRQLLEKWVARGYPALHVEFRGRGYEWFAGELPAMFDWMSRKRRARGFPELGAAEREFQTMRPGDNRFYWIGTDSLRESNINDPLNWSNRVGAATVQAKIGEGNQINVNVKGLKQVTLWLGRDADGRDMIEFNKPATIRVNGAVFANNKILKPSLSTLLEDFYSRGDRQRVFWVKEAVEMR